MYNLNISLIVVNCFQYNTQLCYLFNLKFNLRA